VTAPSVAEDERPLPPRPLDGGPVARETVAMPDGRVLRLYTVRVRAAAGEDS
jgi:hypothetical protein